MALPWNRGDGERSAPRWVDLVPLVGRLAGEGSESDRGERSDPVLVAPHREPGEEAENPRLPPDFERRETGVDERRTPGAAGTDLADVLGKSASAASGPEGAPAGADDGSPGPGQRPPAPEDRAADPDDRSRTAEDGTSDSREPRATVAADDR